jgi:uncharacterized protein YqiB (DUF1249 family)
MKIRENYGCEDVEPRGFVSLMDLYENNFLRFRKLVPDLDALAEHAYSRINGCMGLHITVLDRSRFTTTLRMTYHFTEGSRLHSEPDLKLRVYHDARLVEVLSGHLKHGRQKLEHLPADAKLEKWKLNRFLFKWLGFCLHQGHQFKSAGAGKLGNTAATRAVI